MGSGHGGGESLKSLGEGDNGGGGGEGKRMGGQPGKKAGSVSWCIGG